MLQVLISGHWKKYGRDWSKHLYVKHYAGTSWFIWLVDDILLDKMNHRWALTLSQMTNFRLFQTERVCRQQFQIWWKWQKVFQSGRKHCGKKRNYSLQTISPFPSVFKRHVQQACKNQGLFGKGLKLVLQILGRKFYKNTKKPSLYSEGLLIFIHKTPAVENHLTTREIRELLRPRSTPTGINVYFYMSSSLIYIQEIHRRKF